MPNKYGGKENCDAIDFLKELNIALYDEHPGIMTTAEESTSWPMVTKPAWLGGLGFGYKWNMGWMNDFLSYMSKDPIFRKYCHDKLTFGMWYAYAENFVLPFSHDEVVYGKCSLLEKMPGDAWQKAAKPAPRLRLDVLPSGQKACLYGRRIRAEPRVEPRPEPRAGTS